MKFRILAFVTLLNAASTAHAQQTPSADPLSTYLRKSFAAAMTDLKAVVELMPEADFVFRPVGAVKEVRTFGEIVHHALSTTSWMCSLGEGKADAMSQKPVVDKPSLLVLVNETNTHCTAYLATLTDAALSQVIVGGAAPNQLQAVRGNSVIFLVAHLNEHYGNLVTYIRAKGLVPPATPAQAGALARYTPAKP